MVKFGICDGENDTKAFVTTDTELKWICTVVNQQAMDVEFRAIDYCVIILRKDGNQERICDAMLTYNDNIVFIELKEKVKSWMEDGIDQIQKTLPYFTANHNLAEFRHKRAFVANRRHPDFHVIDQGLKRWFWDNYRIRINVQAEIVVK